MFVAGLETSEVKSIIALLQEKNANHLLEAADIEHLKQLVKELKYVDPASPSHPKQVSELSHKEALETLAQPVNPNAHRDFILDKLYTFLFFVILIVFWIFCTCIGA